jgi:DNA invertase Pin-like site-specific DNA recombinase
VAREVLEQSKAKKVHIVPADLPNLFKHTQTLVEKYVRHIIFGTTELERDLIVQRLRDGVTRKTQSGKPKVDGSKTLLDFLRPSTQVLKKLRAIALRRKYANAGQYGLCTAAPHLSEALSSSQTMAHETARRLCEELLTRQ